jgi:hypothetical protein
MVNRQNQQTMKTSVSSNISRIILPAAIILCMLAASIGLAQTNSAPVKTYGGVYRSNGVNFYEIDFKGGHPSRFFDFWRTNGFENDSFLFAGDMGRIHIPSFKLKDAQLDEVAKSIEFLTEGQLKVEVIERSGTQRGNMWRVKAVASGTAADIKTRACALPNLLSGNDGEKKVHRIFEGAIRVLVESHVALRNPSRPDGTVKVLGEEKIVVVSGSEPFVEAVISTLQAAEAAAATVSLKQ